MQQIHKHKYRHTQGRDYLLIKTNEKTIKTKKRTTKNNNNSFCDQQFPIYRKIYILHLIDKSDGIKVKIIVHFILRSSLRVQEKISQWANILLLLLDIA